MNDTTLHPNGLVPGTGPRGSRLGTKGGKVAQATQLAWDRFSTTEWTEGQATAEAVAESLGLKTESVMGQLHLLARQGHLEREIRPVENTVNRGGGTFTSRRNRTFYRIAGRG